MKKFIVIISCMLVCLGLVACNKEPEQPTDQQPEVQTVRFDCHEFDIESETKTDKILLTINLTDNFTASESLLFQDPTYYIGEYGEVYSTYSKKFLKQSIDLDGYLRVDIHGKHKKVHKLRKTNQSR